MAQTHRDDILSGPIGPKLVRLALPMVLGIAAIIFFNIVDTFWVGQLGAQQLAAMSFTFPVVMVVMSVAMGLSIGGTAVIARALGTGDDSQVKRLTTDLLILANLIVAAIAGIGLLTLEPLFAMLGASTQTRALIDQYMVPWYLGVGLLVIPMVGNGAIRASGDTKTPSYVMLTAGLVNAGLDPLLIFGWGPVPALGLTGAALATIGSYAGSFVVAFWILHKRERMLRFRLPKPDELMRSWGRILYVGLPAAGTNMLTPVAAGVLTRMVSQYGEPAVAAFGVGTRIEGFALVGINALGAAVTPFVAQNLGAGQFDRIWGAVRFCLRAALIWGAGVAVLLLVGAQPLARVFNAEPEVVATTALFLSTVPLSYGLQGMAQVVASALNALNRPLRAALLILVRLVVLAVPLAWLGSHWFGLVGVFGGMAVANAIIGVLAGWVALRGLELPNAQALS